MITRIRPLLKSLGTFLVLFVPATFLQGCGNVVNLEGVYFPSWVLCLLIGVFASSATLYRLQRTSLRDCLPNHGLCFLCFATIFGVLAWLIFFRS